MNNQKYTTNSSGDNNQAPSYLSKNDDSIKIENFKTREIYLRNKLQILKDKESKLLQQKHNILQNNHNMPQRKKELENNKKELE